VTPEAPRARRSRFQLSTDHTDHTDAHKRGDLGGLLFSTGRRRVIDETTALRAILSSVWSVWSVDKSSSGPATAQASPA